MIKFIIKLCFYDLIITWRKKQNTFWLSEGKSKHQISRKPRLVYRRVQSKQNGF